MKCKNPYVKGLSAFGCGQCLPCRINRRRLWTHRLMLESFKHSHNAFVTLTYNEENYPMGGNLDKKHMQDFIKRLRETVAPTRLRYLYVGEYGEQTQRPHYHAAIFGLGRGDSSIIESCWRLGYTYTGDLTFQSAQYIAGYVTKKMTSPDDPRLDGRTPEFGQPSLKPGIGALALDEIIQFMETDVGAEELLRTGDVPSILMHGRTKFPLGRYLRSKLREKYGFEEKTTPKEVLIQIRAEMQQLLKDNDVSTENSSYGEAARKYFLIEKNRQAALNLETRFKIKNGGTL